MLELLAALTLISATPAQEAQTPPPQQTAPVQLEDVEVVGRSLDQLISRFVEEVSEPNRGRGLARWDRGICVGVANLRADAAQYIADRVSTVADDLGLHAGVPGCRPNILVVATDDGAAMAAQMVERRRRAFRRGGSGMDRGAAALRDFQDQPRPVRWWQMSLPTNSSTGDRAVRIPGDCRSSCAGVGSVMEYAPNTVVFAASRVNTQIVDNMFGAIVIVDIDEVADLSILQLADYIAMVSFAQIDPDAETAAFSSILNVFDQPEDSASLTDWDRAYLQGLYGARRDSANRSTARDELVESIRDSHRVLHTSSELAPTDPLQSSR